MTVELDEERGPQIRVIQGKEIPCFLNLFNGRMIVHLGEREEEDTNSPGPWKLYVVKGEHESEANLLEVEKDVSALRSRSSFILFNIKTGLLYIWNGCKTPDHKKMVAMTAAVELEQQCAEEVGLKENCKVQISVFEEGKEKPEFWAAIGSKDRSLYHSLSSGKEKIH